VRRVHHQRIDLHLLQPFRGKFDGQGGNIDGIYRFVVQPRVERSQA